MAMEHSLHAYLLRQSSEKLDLIMRQEFEKGRTCDANLILDILAILEKRESTQPKSYSPEVLAAWERYLESYNSPPDFIPEFRGQKPPRSKR